MPYDPKKPLSTGLFRLSSSKRNLDGYRQWNQPRHDQFLRRPCSRRVASRRHPNREGGRTTPSVVAFTQGGERLVGVPTESAAGDHPRTPCSRSRFIGRKFNEVSEEMISQRQRRVDLDATARSARALRACLPAGAAAALRRQHLRHRQLRRHGTLGAAPQAEDAGPAWRRLGPARAAPRRHVPHRLWRTPLPADRRRRRCRSRIAVCSSPTASTR